MVSFNNTERLLSEYSGDKTVHASGKLLVDYQNFAVFVKKLFPDAKKVLDVGVGLGQSSVELSRQGFIVTSIDKTDYGVGLLLENKGITFINDKFSLSTDISDFDLVVGLHCCDASELIIRNCIDKDIECLITLCELHKGLHEEVVRNRRQYIDYLKNISAKLKETTAPIYEHNKNGIWKETIYYKKPF